MIIGITGTSGSGKTTVSSILAKRKDVMVIDADKIARKLNEPGTDYMKAIENELGKKFILPDGNLDRKKLADEIYSNKDAKQKLDSLTFKYVIGNVLDIIKNENDEGYIVVDIPLLFESGFENFCDYTISLISDYDTKIERICKRDNLDLETAQKRLSIQQEDGFYIEKSDFIIKNTKDCNLEEEIERIIYKIEQNESIRF